MSFQKQINKQASKQLYLQNTNIISKEKVSQALALEDFILEGIPILVAIAHCL